MYIYYIILILSHPLNPFESTSEWSTCPADNLRCSLQRFVNVSARREPAAMRVPGEECATDQDAWEVGSRSATRASWYYHPYMIISIYIYIYIYNYIYIYTCHQILSSKCSSTSQFPFRIPFVFLERWLCQDWRMCASWRAPMARRGSKITRGLWPQWPAAVLVRTEDLQKLTYEFLYSFRL